MKKDSNHQLQLTCACSHMYSLPHPQAIIVKYIPPPIHARKKKKKNCKKILLLKVFKLNLPP